MGFGAELDGVQPGWPVATACAGGGFFLAFFVCCLAVWCRRRPTGTESPLADAESLLEGGQAVTGPRVDRSGSNTSALSQEVLGAGSAAGSTAGDEGRGAGANNRHCALMLAHWGSTWSQWIESSFARCMPADRSEARRLGMPADSSEARRLAENGRRTMPGRQ